MFEEKLNVLGGCIFDEKEKLLYLLVNMINIDCGNNFLDNIDRFDNIDGKVNVYFSDYQFCNNRELSNEENIFLIKSK